MPRVGADYIPAGGVFRAAAVRAKRSTNGQADVRLAANLFPSCVIPITAFPLARGIRRTQPLGFRRQHT
jgi:hypothetical protein